MTLIQSASSPAPAALPSSTPALEPRRQSLLGSLDPRSRRSLVRITAELVVLGLVVAIVYGGPALRGGTAPLRPAEPTSGPLLHIGADEVTGLLGAARLGAFTFDLVSRPGQEPHWVGESSDGGTVIDLLGQADDLRVMTVTLRVFEDRRLEAKQRAHLALVLALFASDALEPLQRALDGALTSGVDITQVARSGFIDVSLETRLQPGGIVAVTLSGAAGPGAPGPGT